MSVMTEGQAAAIPGKARKRTAAKASERKTAETKFKATLLLSHEASQRLSIHAAMKGEDRSTLVDQLILHHLKEWKVSAWGRSAGPADPAADVGATPDSSAG